MTEETEGQDVRRRREAVGSSMAQLAALAGTMARWETGATRRPRRADAILAALDELERNDAPERDLAAAARDPDRRLREAWATSLDMIAERLDESAPGLSEVRWLHELAQQMREPS